ncbi:unnamed protein product [Clonostachys solani]|uniref:Uncharacterized protein n=1 Tax=Clonostachys solani TaxID=160281 RepID=A0A9N9YZU4_9HYPO|nr:unnamed protein product [Clonostachys solani]
MGYASQDAHRHTTLSTTNEQMEEHTDYELQDPTMAGMSSSSERMHAHAFEDGPPRLTQQPEHRSPEPQGHSNDKRRGGRPSWRQKQPSGPYPQRPLRSDSGQSSLDTSRAGNQGDEAVNDTTSTGDAAARQDIPNSLASAMNDMGLDKDPSASSTNVSQQNPSEHSDHSVPTVIQIFQPYQHSNGFFSFADPCQYELVADEYLHASGNQPGQYRIMKYNAPRAYDHNQLSEAESAILDLLRPSDSHQVDQFDTLVHDFGYSTSSAQRHPQAADQSGASTTSHSQPGQDGHSDQDQGP